MTVCVLASLSYLAVVTCLIRSLKKILIGLLGPQKIWNLTLLP